MNSSRPRMGDERESAMTGAAAIEWFLARDNKQYGPLSDLEMRKLVDLKHLKDSDLVWRAGMGDWTAAVQIFPQAFAPAAPSAAAPSIPAPQPAMAPGRPAEPAAAPTAARVETLSDYRARAGERADSGPQLAHPAATPPTAEPARTAQRRMWIAPGDPDQDAQARAETQPRFEPAFGMPDPSGRVGAASWAGPATPMGPAAGGQGWLDTEAPAQQSRAQQGASPRLEVDPAGKSRRARGPQPVAAVDDDDALDDETPTMRRRPRRLVGLFVVVLLLSAIVGGTWFLFQDQQALAKVLAPLGLSSSSSSDKPRASSAVSPKVVPSAANRAQAREPARPVAAAQLQNFPESAAAIDEQLQAGHLWKVVRAEFPEWYGERMTETARLVSEKKQDDAITKHLVDSLIALRRKNAETAYQASLPRLQLVARTFRDSLEQLTKHSHVACYALISSGESSRGMVALFRDPQYSTALQGGLAAVFEAVAEGRRAPVNTLAPRRADYDVLTQELTTLGWSEQDLSLFADPQELARATPERVCKLVREWFTAHLSIPDPAIQHRLLSESIRPVVAG